jgi:large subunit ribosomal protein L29
MIILECDFMAISRAKDIRKMESKDVEKNLGDLKLELAKEKANISIGASVTSPGRIREIKRTIARIHTIKKEGVKK